MATLTEIVEKTGDEEATLRASQILIDDEKYEQAIELLELGQAAGPLEDAGMLYKLKGYAHYGLKNYAKAVVAFQEAAQHDPELEETSEQWISYLQTEFLAHKE